MARTASRAEHGRSNNRSVASGASHRIELHVETENASSLERESGVQIVDNKDNALARLTRIGLTVG